MSLSPPPSRCTLSSARSDLAQPYLAQSRIENRPAYRPPAPLRLTRALCLALALTTPGALAAQTPPPADQAAPEPSESLDEGLGLLERGLRLLLEGLMGEVEPALGELGTKLQDFAPLLRELSTMVGDLTQYEAPERLPNGDILLRRKPGAPPPAPLPRLTPPKSPEQTPTAPQEGIEL